ncbi:MAG: ribosome-associated translation inhibitor RaiA [Cyclobacteriaceae bacterium]|nr:ribosome-associated translation inhibitor RaiA [Cyclobacteriaceae bacterium]
MKLQMHSIHFTADNKLLNYIQKKVDKLETFYDRIVDGEVFLKLNNSSVENKTVEIKLNIPGVQIFAKEDSKTFEDATDMAVEGLRRQLKKHKEKIITH